jgi:NAD(P)H-flavin reductase
MKFLKGKTVFEKYRLIAKMPHTHDTFIYRFELPAMEPLNLPTGQHVIARHIIDGIMEERKYTPITTP